MPTANCRARFSLQLAAGGLKNAHVRCQLQLAEAYGQCTAHSLAPLGYIARSGLRGIANARFCLRVSVASPRAHRTAEMSASHEGSS